MNITRQTATWKAGLLLVCAIALSVAGCEDVVRVDLNQVEPKLVIDAVLTLGGGEFYPITLSYTTDYYDPQFPELVSGALIVVTTRHWVDTMIEIHPGEYFISRGGVVEIGDTMWASVTVDEAVYEAFSTVPPLLPIDSVTFEYQDGGGIGLEEDEGYRAHVHFRDPPDVDNYAQFWVSRGGLFRGEYYLYDGKFSDGNDIDYSYFFFTLPPDDEVSIELRSIDKNTHDYLSTLAEVVAYEDGGNVFDVTPANPNSNWSNGALGHFSIFNVSRLNTRTPIDE